MIRHRKSNTESLKTLNQVVERLFNAMAVVAKNIEATDIRSQVRNELESILSRGEQNRQIKTYTIQNIYVSRLGIAAPLCIVGNDGESHEVTVGHMITAGLHTFL